MKVLGRNKILGYFVLPVLLLATCVLQSTSAQAQMTSVGIDCSQVKSLNLLRQENLRAGRALIECGIVQGGRPAAPGDLVTAVPNVLVSNRSCTNSSNCTKSENMVWSHGTTVVVSFNDHNANQYSGASYSTDGGATFTQILPPPFANGHGTNFGDPIVVYNEKLGKWFAGDLATGCGGQGIGLWTSTDGITWTVGACAHSAGSDDRESMWVDNEPSSGTYGRMYVILTDFTVGQGRLTSAWSDDGTTWHTVALNNGSTFVRPVQLTGSPVGAPRFEGANSTVFAAGMDEGGGGCATRQNLMFKSLDGGLTWTSTTTGPRYSAICDGTCSDNPYFAKVNPIIRHMGWGQPAVGPNGVVHYAYAGLGTGGDKGDIYYVRSADNGATWSTPVQINGTTDAQFKTQWMPSVSADSNGSVTISWYDRFKSTTACNTPNDPGCKYQIVMRQSRDNGVTFNNPKPVTPLINQPAQPDPGVQACYAGDYDYDVTINGNAYITWTEGRRAISSTHVQDVGLAAVPVP